MICLHCQGTLPNDQPQSCPACGYDHQPRPPVAGINHISQLLAALDALRAGDLELDELDSALDPFLAQFDGFEQKWRNGASLAEQLAPSLRERFASTLDGMDRALDEGLRALDILQSLEGEFEDEAVDEAEAALLAFFHGVCSHGAQALADFDSIMAELRASGGMLNIRSS